MKQAKAYRVLSKEHSDHSKHPFPTRDDSIHGYQIMFAADNGTPLQYFCLENPMEGGAW